jgi:glycosyltransferase involved in cell wall biosynthesis
MGAIYNVLALPFFLIRKIQNTSFFWWKTHGKVGKPLERLALIGVDRVFTAGSQSFAIETDKRTIVGHAVDTHQFTLRENTVMVPKDALIMVGRIVSIKRIEVALEVMRMLKAREGSHTYSLTLVGIADSKDYEKSLRDFCTREELDTVHFIGSINHAKLPELYQKSSILIHPAFEAGFDKVVLEAMASGVIPLTSILSFKEILEPYGLYVAPNNVEGYVEGIIRIQNMSTDEHTKLQSALRTLVVEHHSLETLPKRIFGV